MVFSGTYNTGGGNTNITGGNTVLSGYYINTGVQTLTGGSMQISGYYSEPSSAGNQYIENGSVVSISG